MHREIMLQDGYQLVVTCHALEPAGEHQVDLGGMLDDAIECKHCKQKLWLVTASPDRDYLLERFVSIEEYVIPEDPW